MKKTIGAMIVIAVLALPVARGGVVHAAPPGDVGSVVALRGDAVIERDAKVVGAKLKDGIQLRDSVATRDKSRMKMLFIDDSVLTLGEKTKVVIKEFVYSKDGAGKSLFNLLDGKMRSVVGKSSFEIHTPTMVAAARGTVFDCEAGQMNGKSFSTCTSYEGQVEIRSIDPTIAGRVTLRPGMSITVISGQPLPAPTTSPKSAVLSSGAAGGATGPSLPLIQGPSVNMTPPQTKGTDTGGIRVGW